jgi:hypothetical protein
MELLLNILWLLLAVPAAWLWLRDSACAQSSQRLGYLRPMLLLGCVLVLLFPVVSATDDLHAMRPELEESSLSKRALKAAGGEKAHSTLTGLHASPVLRLSLYSFCPNCLVYGRVVTRPSRRLAPVDIARRAGRAPPSNQFSS